MSPAHELLLEIARLHRQLAALSMAGSTREVVRTMNRIRSVRAELGAAEVGPRCLACGRPPGPEDDWRTYLTAEEEGEPPQVVLFCRACAEREVGDLPM
ncbi:MAG: hypothetical protein ACM33B_02320 [Pseudomonadota bacterium]